MDERLDFEFLFDDSYVVAAGAQNSWVRRRRTALKDLIGEPRVLPPPDSMPGRILADAMRVGGLEPSCATMITNSPEARINLLATARFLTIFSTSSLRFPGYTALSQAEHRKNDGTGRQQ